MVTPADDGDEGDKGELNKPKAVVEPEGESKSLDEFLTLAQSMAKWTLVEHKGKKNVP